MEISVPASMPFRVMNMEIYQSNVGEYVVWKTRSIKEGRDQKKR